MCEVGATEKKIAGVPHLLTDCRTQFRLVTSGIFFPVSTATATACIDQNDRPRGNSKEYNLKNQHLSPLSRGAARVGLVVRLPRAAQLKWH